MEGHRSRKNYQHVETIVRENVGISVGAVQKGSARDASKEKVSRGVEDGS